MGTSPRITVVLVLALVTALMVAGGCSGPEPAQAQKTTPAAPIVLKVQSHGGPTNAYRISIERIIKRLEDGSGGRIKVDYYPADALVPYESVLEAVSTGILDIGQTSSSYHVGQIGAPTIFNSMPWNFDPGRFMQNYRQVGYFDYMNRRYLKNNITIVTVLFQPSGDFEWSKKHPVKKMEDLKGLIVSTTEGMFSFFRLLGAQPVALGSAERYDAMQRGTIDVINMGASIAVSSRYWEVADGLTVINTNAGTNMHIMNRDAYNRLPPDLQGLLLNATLDAERQYLADTEKTTQADIATCAKNGMEVHQVSPSEREQWIKATMPAYADIEKKYPGEWKEFTTNYWPSLR